jgi:hypothetical protein
MKDSNVQWICKKQIVQKVEIKDFCTFRLGKIGLGVTTIKMKLIVIKWNTHSSSDRIIIRCPFEKGWSHSWPTMATRTCYNFRYLDYHYRAAANLS